MPHKYPLQDLLRVRKFREDSAAGELTQCRNRLQDARALVVQRKKELEEYTAWRIRREEELYQHVMEQPVQLKALDDLKQDVQLLREEEFAYQQRIHEAEKTVSDAEAALEAAHLRYQEASKNRRKIDEHKELWAQEMAKLDEAAQEKELEDFRVRTLESSEESDHV